MIKVNHTERKRIVAERALRLFSQVGYDNVSLNMIAASCGIARTVIYRYFCSKREVLDASIRQVTELIAEKCRAIVATRNLTTAQKLEGVCHAVTDEMFAHREFLIAVFDFVVGMVRTGADMNGAIAEFTTGTRKIIQMLVAHGKRRGEFPSILIEERTTDAIYAEFESCAMRIVLGTERDPKAARVRLSDVVKAISSWQ